MTMKLILFLISVLRTTKIRENTLPDVVIAVVDDDDDDDEDDDDDDDYDDDDDDDADV